MKLTPSITLVPIVHGRCLFAAHVRSLCVRERFDCIAVDIPETFQDEMGPAVESLPYIKAVVARDVSEERCCCYVPVDPCDAAIEGIRQSFLNRVPFYCIGQIYHDAPPLRPLPDEYALTKIGFDAFSALCLQAIGNPEAGSVDDEAAAHIADRLRELSASHANILALVHARRFTRTVYRFGRPRTPGRPPLPLLYRTSSHYINPDHLYFALGELPFITGKFERERYDPFAEPLDQVTEIKNLFRETRDDYFDEKEKIAELSPPRIQAALTFARNLSIMSGRLLPTLFDIVEAAKGVGGNGYALRVLANARYYPYLPFETGEPLLGVGIDRIRFPGSDETVTAVNLFRDTEMEWRTLSIRPDPSIEKKKKYRFIWNPLGICSHVPEDEKIERFNAHVRAKAKKALVEELAKTEKFSSSVKDGIDIRETLRNWYTGSIYVKEIPPSRGRIDTVVVIFDQEHDETYPHRATWYAEHGEESTLTFYATDPFENLIGPGIARCRYGGLSLLFPPRPVPNVFELTLDTDFPSLAARLTYGALLFSKETAVAYVADRKPGTVLTALATKLKKRLIWIPRVSFSEETMRKLRAFHILNGKEVRSWAARFIGEG